MGKARDYWKDRLYDSRYKLAVKCKHCGHEYMLANKKGYRVCLICKNLVFANDKIEQEYRKEEFKKRLRRKINE